MGTFSWPPCYQKNMRPGEPFPSPPASNNTAPRSGDPLPYTPPWAPHQGAYAAFTGPGKDGVVVPLRERLLYTQDWIGLKVLDQEERSRLLLALLLFPSPQPSQAPVPGR